MHTRWILVGMLVAVLPARAAAQQPEKSKQPAEKNAAASQTGSAAPTADDEKAIRATVDAFAKAYNAGNAKALAGLFVANGEIMNEEGEYYQGQDAIERVFAEVFRLHPKAQIQIAVDSIRLIGPSLAIEDGTSTVSHESGEQPERNRYMVVHVKQDGAWRMAGARDLPDESGSAAEELEQLAWMIGEWVDESPDAVIFTSYRWDENHRAILSEFKIHVAGRPAMSGTQRIGWDPRAKMLRCWTFDSEGGFSEGTWTRSSNEWIAKMQGVTHDGKTASATNIMARVGKDRSTWQSRDRIIGDECLPDIGKVTVVRKPPQPAANATDAQPKTTGASK
jgi:uncharacterized protein (TIGR02246 family)